MMLRAFITATAIMTILPVGRFFPNEKDLHRSVDMFAVVGLLLAVIIWGAGTALAYSLPPVVLAAVMTVIPEFFTKGLHLDGLADTADGFLSSRSRERKLEIMRDSHTGTMGVAAISALFLIKFACLATMSDIPAAAASMALTGRCALTFHIASSKYAAEHGSAAIYFGRIPWLGMCLSIVIAASAGWMVYGAGIAVWLTGVTVFLPLLWSMITYRVIGGATGDTIGCCEELSEAAALLVLAALL